MDKSVDRAELKPSPEKDSTRLNILIVDDEPEYPKLLKMRIEGSLFKPLIGTITIAMDGQKALDILKDNREEINIVFTDGQMLRMNGLDLAKRIKASGADIVIGLISGGMGELDFNKPGDIARVQGENGIDAVLSKPFIQTEFVEFMEKIKDLREEKNLAA